MTLSSMTGFARTDGQLGHCAWTWEVKSVNGKGLDIRFRLPGGFDSLEKPIRDLAQHFFKRGNFSIGLMVKWSQETTSYQINQNALSQLLDTIPEIQKKVPDILQLGLGDILNVRGIVEPVEEALEDIRDELIPKLQESAETVFAQLQDMRDQEGARMGEVLAEHLGVIEGLKTEAGRLAALQPDALAEKLRSQIADIVKAEPQLPEEKLAHEVALLVSKADVREELDRLTAHCDAARDLLGKGEPVGRKLDFLCQEFNREANTLCSKSPDVELTRIGLDLKAAIEQFREQVQNIE